MHAWDQEEKEGYCLILYIFTMQWLNVVRVELHTIMY